jgi:hypothetical protein
MIKFFGWLKLLDDCPLALPANALEPHTHRGSYASLVALPPTLVLTCDGVSLILADNIVRCAQKETFVFYCCLVHSIPLRTLQMLVAIITAVFLFLVVITLHAT